MLTSLAHIVHADTLATARERAVLESYQLLLVSSLTMARYSRRILITFPLHNVFSIALGTHSHRMTLARLPNTNSSGHVLFFSSTAE